MGREKHTQFIDVVRRELDGKIDGKIEYLDTKIDNRVSSSTFRWMIGIIIGALIVALGGLFAYSNGVNAKVDAALQRITIVETKISERTK